MRRLKLGLILAGLILGTGVFASASPNVTLKLVDELPNISDGGVYVYPYNFSINGSTTLTALLCDDYNDDIVNGESWTASVSTGSAIPTSGQMVGSGSVFTTLINNETKAYEDAAYLYEQLLVLNPGNLSQNAIINETIWSLFRVTSDRYAALYSAILANNNAIDNNSGDLAYWYSQAQQHSSAADLDAVTLYTPVDQTEPGRPQEFFGPGTVTITRVTPEPSSLVLIGIGLIGFGIVSRKQLSRG